MTPRTRVQRAPTGRIRSALRPLPRSARRPRASLSTALPGTSRPDRNTRSRLDERHERHAKCHSTRARLGRAPLITRGRTMAGRKKKASKKAAPVAAAPAAKKARKKASRKKAKARRPLRLLLCPLQPLPRRPRRRPSARLRRRNASGWARVPEAFASVLALSVFWASKQAISSDEIERTAKAGRREIFRGSSKRCSRRERQRSRSRQLTTADCQLPVSLDCPSTMRRTGASSGSSVSART